MKTIAAVFLALTLAACTRIPVGYRGIVVHLHGANKGVDPKPLGVGRHFMSPIGMEVHRFPVAQRNYVWNHDRAISFQSSDGVTLHADIGINYRISEAHVVEIFQKFRRGIDEISNVYLRNIVMHAFNNAAANMRVESVFGKGRVELLNRVNKEVIDRVKTDGILVDHVYFVGDFRVPRRVVDEINAKAEAEQRAQRTQRELKEVEAQGAKREAQERSLAITKSVATKAEADATRERAKAEADATRLRARANADAALIRAEAQARAIRIKGQATADALLARLKAEAEGNQKLTQSLSRELVQMERVRRWNGSVPTFVGGGTLPFLQLDKLLDTRAAGK
jgi:regulator of protease activity HflC (stomatin/prohibitin superfamily)